MSQATTETALQAAAQHIVALNAAQAVGIAWFDPVRRDLVWAALVGPLESKTTLASLAQRVVNGGGSVHETREDGWVWASPVTGTSLHGALVALGPSASPAPQELLTVLTEAATVAADLVVERQRTARLQRWLTTAGRSVATGNLVTGFAHRINNPLTTIIGEAQLLQTESFSPGVLASLGAIERAGQRIRTTVQAVVQFTHGNGAVEYTDLNTTVETALGLVTSQLEGAGVRLTARLAPNLPPVHANTAALTEAWVHLLIHAWQAIPVAQPGEVRIATTARNGYLLVTVADNGPVAVRRRRLLQPFAPDTRGELFLAWDLLTRAGGQVIVASRPGIGTTIGVRLPLKTAPK
jgi:signal transduction histidine kinase